MQSGNRGRDRKEKREPAIIMKYQKLLILGGKMKKCLVTDTCRWIERTRGSGR